MTEIRERRRQVLLACALWPLAGAARAQANYPDRPIRLIVQVPAGTAADAMMRAMGEFVSRRFGQPVIVENRVGASGTLGPVSVAKTAAPDGYTLTVIPVSLFRLPYMQDVNFNPSTDFTYIANLSAYTFGTVVRAESPIRSFAQMVEMAKQRPDELTYATPGAGSTQHLTMEQICTRANIRLKHIPYKGTPDALVALLGGHVDMVADASAWTPMVEAGKARLLCTWGATRPKKWKDVPTLTELGIPLVADSPTGIGGPKGMDPAVIAKVRDAFAAALSDPKVQETLETLQMVPRYMDTETYNKFVTTEIRDSKPLIERLGLSKRG
jgi:tripartite-type tricarboxylate transporter receptor subunit TctC